MIGVYAFAAIFGGLLLVVFLFGGGDFDADADLDFDGDLDLDGLDHSALQVLGTVLSLRNIVFYAAFFGLAGVLLNLTGTASALTLILAIAVGFGAAFANHKVMAYLSKTSSDSKVTNDRIAGNVANVVLPIAARRKGKVSVEVDGHRLYLIALPYKPSDDHSFDVGDKVVIVSIENGSALVTAAEF